MSNNFEQFINEVESDLRQEKFEALWKKYGKTAIICFVTIIALSAGFNLWQYYQTKQRDIISGQFSAAQELMFSKNMGDALAAMENIAKASHRTYSTLAKFNIATILRQPTGHQDLARAEKIYQEIMDDSKSEHLLRELATISLVSLRLDTLKEDKVEEFEKLLKLLNNCEKNGDPYRHLALELHGMIELRKNDFAKAAEIFTKIAQDEKTPKDLRLRAQMVTQNIASKLTN